MAPLALPICWISEWRPAGNLAFLVVRAEKLYDRVLHLDRRMYLDAPEVEAVNPVQSQLDRLAAAYAIGTLRGGARVAYVSNEHPEALCRLVPDADSLRSLLQSGGSEVIFTTIEKFALKRGPDGKLDMERYRQLAASQGMTPEMFEARVRRDLSNQQVLASLQASALASPR